MRLMHIYKRLLQGTKAGQSPGNDGEVSIIFYFPVDISTTVFFFSYAVQYHMILDGLGECTGVIV